MIYYDTTNEEDNELFFWDSLLDLHDGAKDIIAEHTARLRDESRSHETR